MPLKNLETLDIVKTLSSKPRLKALLLLFIYRSMSLTVLSQMLNKSKNTTLYHMQMLLEHDLVEEFDEKIPSSIKPIKNYQLRSDFYKKLYVPFEDISKRSKEQALEQSKTLFRYNILLFETIREILSQIQTFYMRSQKEIKTSEDALNFHQHHPIPRDLIPLSENAYVEYQENYRQLISKTLRTLETEDEISQSVLRPYLVFNAIIPIKDLFEKMSI